MIADDHSEDLVVLVDDSLRLAEETIALALVREDVLVRVVVHHLLILWRDAGAIRLLCQEGRSDAAILVLRRSWETSLRLQFIQLDSAKRSRQFFDESWVREWRILQRSREGAAYDAEVGIASAVREDPRLDQRSGELKDEREHVSDAARARAEAPRRAELWTVGNMAEALKRREEYDFVYSFLSDRLHGGPDAAKDLVERAEDGLRIRVLDYSELCLGMVAAWLIDATDTTLECLDSPRRPEAQELWARLQRRLV